MNDKSILHLITLSEVKSVQNYIKYILETAKAKQRNINNNGNVIDAKKYDR